MPSFTDIVKAIEFFNLCQTATFDVICQKANEEPSLVDARDTLGNSPLHIIVERFDTIFLPDVFKPNVNVVNNVGETPLHICVKLDKYHLAGILRNEFRGNLYLGNYADKNTRITLINSMSPKMKKVLKIKDLNIPPPSPLVRSTPVFSSITIIGRPQSRRLEKVEEEKKEETLKDRITKSNLPEEFKKAAIEKEDSISCNYGSSAAKDKEWVETLLKLPLNNYSSLPVSKKTSSMEDIKSFFKKVNDTLDEVSYGLDNVKEEIVDCISQMISTNNDCMPRILCLQGSQGCGKCLAKGTKILMFDGTLKNVEDIQVGDVIMGDDSTPRNILALGKGKDQMYRIDDVKGEKYTVNSEHILTLTYAHSKIIQDDKKGSRYRVKWFDNNKISIVSKNFSYKNEPKEDAYEKAKLFLDSIDENKVCDISIKDYLKLSKNLKEDLKGTYTGIDFPNRDLDFDPYILGLWLGDGSKNATYITNQDASILKYLSSTLNNYNCYLQHSDKYNYRINSCDNSKIKGSNYMMNILRKHNLINNKHIPHIYKCNSRENRLKLLAGLIDSDGYLDYSKTGFEISQSIEHEKLLDDIQYLCRSLGFSCIKSQKKTSWTYLGVKNTGIAWRLSISGNGLHEIPTLVPRKKANKRKQIKNPLISGITVTPTIYDDYYGFEIDGNKRFVLGNFIVTHNTSIVRGGISKILNRPFQHINMGGISDADYLIGHEQTYVGSRPGMIVQSLINSKVMNPIIFMDEVDKVSNTDKGVDIQSVLIHLTDPIQNTEFQDKYFAGLKLDVSKALFIFSCNDESKISPILRDRLNIIRIKEPTVNDKIIIGKKYLLKEISPNVGLKVEDILIDEECIKYVLNTFCKDEIGLRGLKKCLETLLRKINTSLYAPSNKYSTLKDVSLPVKVSKKMIDEILVKPENKFSEAMQSMFV